MCDHISLINKSRCILQGEVNQIRHEYKTGEYELCFEGDKDALISSLEEFGCCITNHKQGNDKRNSVQQKININVYRMNFSGNDLLAKVIPMVKVISFNEILPSMNDIFKFKVNE
jgi:ABC-2 type transport system ATP-binding protein